RLEVHREVWELAELGDPQARRILAHEIGHLVLHDHYAQSYSNNIEGGRNFLRNRLEESAEWQAITFESFFLVPDVMLQAFKTVENIINYCNVPRELAQARVASAAEDEARKERV